MMRPDRDYPTIGHRDGLSGGFQFIDGENSSLNDRVSGGHVVILSGAG